MPAFHAEALIQVSFDGQATVLRMATMTSSLWNYEQESNYHQQNSTDPLGDPPELIEEVCHIGVEDAGKFWGTIDDLVAKGVKSTCNSGLDGISVRVVHRHLELKAAFEAWSPANGSPQGVFVGKLFDLAWNTVRDETMMQRLEQIYGYLRGDLPVRWIENEIKTLRVFGSLTSYDEDGLRSLFATLPKDEPLVFDLTNFEGMGTILYPTIREFASQHDQLAWACSAAAAKHLQQMEIDSRRIFESVGQAVEYIRSQMEQFE